MGICIGPYALSIGIKIMTLNDLCAIYKVSGSLNAAKMAKYDFVMTSTPCRVAGCIISVRCTYSCTRALTYLITYTVGSGRVKPAISPKRLKIERKLLLTAYKVVHGLSIADKMYDLE